MTKKEFFSKIVKGRKDLLQEFINLLKKKKIPFCIVGGLAVNAYAEAVVSLDLDVVVVVGRLEDLLAGLRQKYKVRIYPNSINISSPYSDLRIQLQTDPRYQDFIRRAVYRDILGYKLPVARIEDVLRGKIWAALDKSRRLSKRQKDLADILRMVEAKSGLISLIPYSLKRRLGLRSGWQGGL